MSDINDGSVDFSCRVCGVQCAVAPDPPERAVCEEHCPGHEYEYDRGEREWHCKICFKVRPYDEDFDW